jgi:hypothetical protein
MTTILQKTLAFLVDKDECNDVDRSVSNKIYCWFFQMYAACSECPDISEDAFCSGGAESAPCFDYMWGDAGYRVFQGFFIPIRSLIWGDLWFAQSSLLALLAGASGVARVGFLGLILRWLSIRSG